MLLATLRTKFTITNVAAAAAGRQFPTTSRPDGLRLLHQTHARHSIPQFDANNPTLRKIQENARVMTAMTGAIQLLQKKGFVDPHNPKPPSFMKLMQMMSDTEIKKTFTDMQTVLKEEGISFSPADLSAFMNSGTMSGDGIKTNEAEPNDNNNKDAGLLKRISNTFKART
ncbi:hypothetical protein BX661DRAFT_188071 [Kickxella alabastrina]|uniref:uncharacterized protein n=1 Tax=Kickxella alabastrina TaxID=61397 RepID=UPI0022210686|nr:uncharacterized protein BX661DRAFT_188071 [Kickxella alabastrina]KAI7821847.1 hypothetical protein BX661DRAFT_188071 [Kickxella alabastrina]